MTKPSDALDTLGTILDGDLGRDAVHIAVCAPATVYPSQRVTKDGFPADTLPDAVGIVDPFLPDRRICKGEWFWLCLFPRTITGLSHVWSHPAFTDAPMKTAAEVSKESSENWLRHFCYDNDCPDYETVMAKAKLVAEGRNDAWDDNYLHFDDMDAHGEIPAEFWGHVEIVLDTEITGTRPNYFSCAC